MKNSCRFGRYVLGIRRLTNRKLVKNNRQIVLLLLLSFLICLQYFSPVKQAVWGNLARAYLTRGAEASGAKQGELFDLSIAAVSRIAKPEALAPADLYTLGLAEHWSLPNQSVALNHLERAAKIGHQGAQIALGYHYLNLGDVDNTTRYLNEDTCGSLRCTLDLSTFLYKSGLSEQSLEVLSNYVERHPDSASLYYHFATVYWGSGQRALSIASLKAAIAFDKTSDKARLHYQMARLAYLEKRYVDAIDLLLPLVANDSNSLSTVYLLGQAYFALQKYQDAEKWLLQAKEINSEYTGVYVNLANVYSAQDLNLEAVDAIQKASLVEKNVNNIESHLRRLMDFYIQLGMTCESNMIEQAIQENKIQAIELSGYYSEMERFCT